MTARTLGTPTPRLRAARASSERYTGSPSRISGRVAWISTRIRSHSASEKTNGSLERFRYTVPFGLGEDERVAREVQVHGPVEVAVRKRMVLVRAEVA